VSALFDEFERTDPTPALYAEDSFVFMNRAAGAVWQRIRDELERWDAAFPEDTDLRQRFRSRDPRQHYAAWWELYLHNLFTSLGYRLTVHPEIPGTKGHPDFLIERDDESFYLEAATIFSGIVAAGRRALLEAEVQDIINTIDPSDFMVSLSYERVGERMPGKRAITDPIEAWLSTLDADALLADAAAGVVAASERITFGDWAIELRPISRAREYRGCPDNRLIGAGAPIAGPMNDVDRIRRALIRKSKSYGTPDKPLVVAALAVNGFVENNDVEGALFGSLAVRVHIATGATVYTRNRDGVWVGERGASGRRISAVLIGVSIIPGTIASAWPRLWYHFDPRYALGAELPFSTAHVVGEHVEFEDAAQTPSEVLGLRADWPGPEPPFIRCAHRPGDHAGQSSR
jgi:hypothetical protein